MSEKKRDPLYDIWHGAVRRTTDPRRKDYKNYGGKGIRMCDEWRGTSVRTEWNNKGFQTFKAWSLSHGYVEGYDMQLDRVCNARGYSPDNCRWVTRKQNSYNRSTNHMITICGETHALEEWARMKGIGPDAIIHRVGRGWTWEEAILIPNGERRKKKE